MIEVKATCGNSTPETGGVIHDLRELNVAEARLTMYRALEELNREEGANMQVREMRQCAHCAILFTEFIDPQGWTLLHMHLPPEGLMI